MIRSVCSCVGASSSSYSVLSSFTGRAIARRITTRPTNSSRWRGVITPIHSATFFYSALFAAAVVADGRIKSARSHQWDLAIEAVEKEINDGSEKLCTEEHTQGLRAETNLCNDSPTRIWKRKRRTFENLCRKLALEWRAKGGHKNRTSTPPSETALLSNTDPDSLISREEWLQFEEWAVAQIRAHNESLPTVNIGEGRQGGVVLETEDNPDAEEEETVGFGLSNLEQATLPWGRLHMRARHQEFTSNKTVDSRLRLWLRRENLPDYSIMSKNVFNQFILDRMLSPEDIVRRWESNAFDGIRGPSIHDVYGAQPHLGRPVIGKPRSARRFPPQSIEATRERKHEWLFRPKSAAKSEKLRLSTAKMVSRLFRASNSFDQFCAQVRDLPDDDPLKTYLRPTVRQSIELTRHIEYGFVSVAYREVLKAERTFVPVALPTYDSVDASTLNADVYRILCRLELGEISQVTALTSVCRSLLQSRSPPDVTTFGLLLSAFSDPANHRVFTAIYWEMIRARIRPDENCCAISLYHFAARCDPVRFLRFHSKMLGASSGLMLANPELTEPSRLVSRFQRHHSLPQKIIQIVTPHPLIFQYTIFGLLKFLPDADVLEYISMQIKRGWSLSMEALGLLIRAAAASVDWKAGQMAWNLVQVANKLGQEGVGSVGGQCVNIAGIITHGGIPRDVYVAMLVLCRVCEQKATFRDLLDAAVQAGWEEENLVERTNWLYGRLEKGVNRKRQEMDMEKQDRDRLQVSGLAKAGNGPNVVGRGGDEGLGESGESHQHLYADHLGNPPLIYDSAG